MRIEYTARRNLAAGHTLDGAYEIVVLGERWEPAFDFEQTRNVSLDRSRVEVDLWGTEQFIDVTTDFIPIGTATAHFEEFLHSVAAGEDFLFDPSSDTAALAVSPLTVMMESSKYRRDRSMPGYYRYSFVVRVAA